MKNDKIIKNMKMRTCPVQENWNKDILANGVRRASYTLWGTTHGQGLLAEQLCPELDEVLQYLVAIV